MTKLLEKYKKLSIVAKAAFWFMICSFLQKGISIIVTPIFTRLLSASEYGNYNVFTSWESIMNIFVSLCLSSGVYQQGLVKYEDDAERFSSSMQGLTLVIVVFWLMFYLIFHNFINNIIGLDTIFMVAMISIIWTNNVFAFWANEQKVQFKYKKLILLTIITSILNPVLGIVLVTNLKDKVLARVLGIAVIGLVFHVPLFVKQIKKGGSLYNKKYWKYALLYNIPLIPHYLSQIVLSSSDKIMIEKLIDSKNAGIYSLAYSIALIMTMFNRSLMQAVTPWMYKKIKNKEFEKIKKVSYFSLVSVATLNLLLIAFAPEAVAIFAPSEYYEAIMVIPPVAMSVYFMFTYDLFAKFEFYYEKTKLISLATIIGAILNIVLNYIFISKFGYIAAAYTTLICYILYSIFHYRTMCFVCKKELKMKSPYDIKILILISVVFIAIGFVFNALYNYFIIRYMLIVVIILILLYNSKKIMSMISLVLSDKK